ncbi:MAG: rRNA maturation RNase YbeY [Puniceicoccales bacterium]|nr:rRNA maturation RNase YbeY [Puniceicoccales bacterium]
MKKLRTIEFYNRCRRVTIPEENVRDLFHRLDAFGKFPIGNGELSVAFVSEKKIKAIHSQFLGDRSPTDVITFPGDTDLDFAGEIIVYPLYAFAQSKRYGTTFPDEVKLYLVHGYLHLHGLGDKTEKETEQMRRCEALCMNYLKNFALQVSLKEE